MKFQSLLYNSLLSIWGVITLLFIIFNILPNDPARLTMGQRSDIKSLENINKELGLDKPILIQYLFLLRDVSPISVYKKKDLNTNFKHIIIISLGTYSIVLKEVYLRKSYQTGIPVLKTIKGVLFNTFVLATFALFLATLLGIIIGLIAGYSKSSWVDNSIMFLAISGLSTPSFIASVVIAYVFGYLLNSYTGLSMFGSLLEVDGINGEYIALKNIILPAICLGIRPTSIIAQLTRNGIKEVLKSDYIRTAKAKGVSPYRILMVHSLKNTLNPLITSITGWFASLLAGAFFVEYIFGWNGIGRLTINAVLNADFPVVMGTVLTISFIFIIVNIISDILYKYVDPRMR